MKSIVLFVMLVMTTGAFGQSLKFKVDGQKDTTIFLVKYFGKGLFYADTAEMKGGIVEFDGSKQKFGILAVMLPGQNLLEFIYNNEDVYIETALPNLLRKSKVVKSKENKVFLNYMIFMQNQSKKGGEIGKRREGHEKGSPQYEELGKQMDELTKEVEAYQKKVVEDNKDLFVSKVVKLSMDIKIPEAPVDENGVITDSNFRYNYFKEHYWDNMDLKDSRLVRTPVFHGKMERYFGKRMIVQHWDTVINHAFNFIDRLERGSDLFQYVVSYITSTYEQSKIMGMDKVFVYMAKEYYCTPDENGDSPAFWMTEDKLEKLCDKAETHYRLVMGAKPPNIILTDSTETKWKDFYSLDNEFTILYFWDPECGHCKKITPKLQTLYKKKFRDRGIDIFAVGKAIGEDFEKWKKFIRVNNLEFINVAVTDNIYKKAMDNASQLVPKYTTLESLNYQQTYDIFATPKVWVLDKDKRIIAKSISISQLEDLLDRIQGFEDSPKLFPPTEDPEDEQMH